MTTNNNNERRKLDLLNCPLPENNTSNIRSILIANHLPFHIPDTDDRWAFNCWGYVALNFGWVERPRWIETPEMETLLAKHTSSIEASEAGVGDIVVFRGYEGLLKHTALMTSDSEIVCHKPGSTPLEINTLENVRVLYGTVTYVRPKDSRLIEEKTLWYLI